MNDYPVTLNLTGKICVIVGGGRVAARKAVGLVEAGASVVVVSPEINPTLQQLADQQQVQWDQQVYQPGLLAKYHPLLAFAATNRTEVNRQVVAEAHRLGLLVNNVDDSHHSDFLNMATIRRPPLMIALNTGGASPALSRHLREVIDQTIGDEYATLAGWLGELRFRIVKQDVTQPERQQLYNLILESDILNLLRNGEIAAARQRFDHFLHSGEMLP